MRRVDKQFLRSTLGKGKFVEFQFSEYEEYLNIDILKNPEYDSLYTIHFSHVIEYSPDSKAMRYIKQIYPDFTKAFVYTYDRVGPKDRDSRGYNILKECDDYIVYENDCSFIVAVPNINELNLSLPDERIRIGLFEY